MNSTENRTVRLIGTLRGLSRRALTAAVGCIIIVGVGLALTVQAVATLVGPDAPANAAPATAVQIKPGAGTFGGTTVGATPYVDSDSAVVNSTVHLDARPRWTGAGGAQRPGHHVALGRDLHR